MCHVTYQNQGSAINIHRFQGLGCGILGTTFRTMAATTVLVIIKWYLKVSFICIFGYHFLCVRFLFLPGFMRLQRTELCLGYLGWSGFFLKYVHTLWRTETLQWLNGEAQMSFTPSSGDSYTGDSVSLFTDSIACIIFPLLQSFRLTGGLSLVTSSVAVKCMNLSHSSLSLCLNSSCAVFS